MGVPKSKLSQVIFWSVISAAFIGPGTLATASSAGAGYGLALLWALTMAIIVCIVLQEAAARVMVCGGVSLGEAIAQKYGKQGAIVKHLIVGSIVFGCAAYQAGNILGGVSGLTLLVPIQSQVLVVVLVALAGIILWFGSYRFIANIMGVIVALMGAVFIMVALKSDVSFIQLTKALAKPTIPQGSGMIILGLIGTTVVPYNLFLGSGIGRGQTLPAMRFGLVAAIAIGGIISIAILITGTLVEEKLTFLSLSTYLSNILGPWATPTLGVGLFAAGFSSAITAPLAAAITATTVYQAAKSPGQGVQKKYYRLAWMGVMFFGLVMGVTGFKPIPLIILAQAVNGLLLPFITTLLLFVINDRRIMGNQNTNGVWGNLVLLIIVGCTVLLGLNNLTVAGFRAIGNPDASQALPWLVGFSCTIVLVLGWQVFSAKKKNA